MPHVWICLIMHITACVSYKAGQNGLVPGSGEVTTVLGWNIWFHLLACAVFFFFLFFLLLLPYGASTSPTETDSEGILEARPAVPNDLLNLIPVWWSSSVLAPWFPGEDEVGNLGAPPSLLFLSCSQFLLCSSLSHIPWGYHAPSSLSVREPGWLLPFARKTSLR